MSSPDLQFAYSYSYSPPAQSRPSTDTYAGLIQPKTHTDPSGQKTDHISHENLYLALPSSARFDPPSYTFPLRYSGSSESHKTYSTPYYPQQSSASSQQEVSDYASKWQTPLIPSCQTPLPLAVQYHAQPPPHLPPFHLYVPQQDQVDKCFDQTDSMPYSQPSISYLAPTPPGRGQEPRAKSQKHKKGYRSVNHLRPHECPVCAKGFSRPSSLMTHMAVHTGARPFSCVRPACGRRFSVLSNLRRHERSHESREVRNKAAAVPSETLKPSPDPLYPVDVSETAETSGGQVTYSHARSLSDVPRAINNQYPQFTYYPLDQTNEVVPYNYEYDYSAPSSSGSGAVSMSTLASHTASTPFGTGDASGHYYASGTAAGQPMSMILPHYETPKFNGLAQYHLAKPRSRPMPSYSMMSESMSTEGNRSFDQGMFASESE